MLFQRLWLLTIGWDDPVPDDIVEYWLKQREELKLLAGFKIPRWLGTRREGSLTDLHCFADASELAYAGVVYARTQYADGSIRVSLVSAKTRVSPLRSISVAKLELCAADLVANLAQQIEKSFNPLVSKIYGWTDSMNALAWLQSHPSRWSVFVANRVARVQSIILPENWFHVASDHNPADCASRGMLASKLLDHHLWWNGPNWLAQHPDCWPPPQIKKPDTTEELRPKKVLVHISAASAVWNLYAAFSSFIRLKRITAYWMRFIFNTRQRIVPTTLPKTGPLASSELQDAENYWIKQIQLNAYSDEIACCRKSTAIPLQSPIARLNIFLDDKGILRVGGRIKHATVSSDAKFPIIVPAKSPLASMIVNDLHKMLLHAGPQLMQATLQRRFWVVGARNLVRSIYRSCVTCRRHSVTKQHQIMANLPKYRVNSGRPFLQTGIDMAGPFLIKFSKGRGAKSTKGYIAVFICMATGAMHLELAADLSSETFVGVLKRFVARRGHCCKYYSDNGTNFVGAERDLQNMYQQILRDDKLRKYLADSGMEWNFNPPNAPHMGGYWEIAVKRVKFHLKRALTSTLLTYEEFYTILVEVEACVNSRPLCPLSSDASDLETLTPGHFLIGEPLKVLPEPEVLGFKGSLNQRWQLISQIRRHFWRRWHLEYLVTLQRRSKWLRPQKNIEVNDLVVIRDDNVPPAKWRMARVIKCCPGDDGKVRAVQLKTAEGTLTRPIVKIVPILAEAQKT